MAGGVFWGCPSGFGSGGGRWLQMLRLSARLRVVVGSVVVVVGLSMSSCETAVEIGKLAVGKDASGAPNIFILNCTEKSRISEISLYKGSDSIKENRVTDWARANPVARASVPLVGDAGGWTRKGLGSATRSGDLLAMAGASDPALSTNYVAFSWPEVSRLKRGYVLTPESGEDGVPLDRFWRSCGSGSAEY